MSSAGDAPPELQRQLIMFSLHGEHYALPIASVQEIIRYTPPRVTAAARGLIRGLINLRGRVLPILDLSSRLGQVLEVTDATRILVIEVANGVVGLIVDTVEGVVDIAPERVEPIPGADADDALGSEIAAIDDHLVMLIDPERALGRALPARATSEQAADGASAGSAGSADVEPALPPEPDHPPRPTGPPPARRRSAATPQMPRSRRRPAHPKDREE